MKYFALIILVIFLMISFISAQENKFQKHTWNEYYIGINPISYISAFQLSDEIKRYIPEVAGLEYGFSVLGGYFQSSKQRMEARFSIGNLHQVARVGQFHFGTNYHMFKRSEKWFKDLYLGGFIKYWDYYNKLTKVHFYNIAPYVVAGFLFEIKQILLDVRLNQTFAVYSWSSLEHSSAGVDWFFSPWPKFLPVMPSLTFSVAWRIS